jgi:hypothetical protein
MTAKLTLLNRRLVVEASGTDVKTLFRELGLMTEIFEADCTCGACHSQEIRPSVRIIDGFEYYALHCTICGAELSFGQSKDGCGLYPKRKTDDGTPLPDNGWRRYQQRVIDAANFPSGRGN